MPPRKKRKAAAGDAVARDGSDVRPDGEKEGDSADNEEEDKDIKPVLSVCCCICGEGSDSSTFAEARLVICDDFASCGVAFHRWCVNARPDQTVQRAAIAQRKIKGLKQESSAGAKHGKKAISSSAAASNGSGAGTKRLWRSSSKGTTETQEKESSQENAYSGKSNFVNCFTLTRNMSVLGGAAIFAVEPQRDVMDEDVFPADVTSAGSAAATTTTEIAATTAASAVRDGRSDKGWQCQMHRCCAACSKPASPASPIVVTCDGCQQSWHTMQNCVPLGLTESVREDFALGRVTVDRWAWTPEKGKMARERDAVRAPWFCAQCQPLSVHPGLLPANQHSDLHATTETWGVPVTEEQAYLLSAALPWECEGRSHSDRNRLFRFDPTQIALFFQYWIERHSIHDIRYWRLHKPMRDRGLAVPFSPFRTKNCYSLETAAASSQKAFGNFIRNYDQGSRWFFENFKPGALPTDKNTGVPLSGEAGAGRRLRSKDECRRAFFQSIIYRLVNNVSVFEQWSAQSGKGGGAAVWARETKGKKIKPTVPFNKATVKSWLVFVRQRWASNGSERLFNPNHQNCGYRRYIETVKWVASDKKWNNGKSFTDVLEQLLNAESREQAFNALFGAPHVASFFGAIILDDMENCGVTRYNVCDQRYAPLGPGARQGLAMIFPGITEVERSKDWRPFLEFLIDHSRTFLARLAPTPAEGLAAVNSLRLTVDAIDLENALCGYMRVAQELQEKHRRGFGRIHTVAEELPAALVEAYGEEAETELRAIKEGNRISYRGCPGVVTVVFRNEWDFRRGFRIGIALDAPVPGGHNGTSCTYRKGQAQLTEEQQKELPGKIAEMERKFDTTEGNLRQKKLGQKEKADLMKAAATLSEDFEQARARLEAYNSSSGHFAAPQLFFLCRPGCGLFVWSRNVEPLVMDPVVDDEREFLPEWVAPLEKEQDQQQRQQSSISIPPSLPRMFNVRWQGYGAEHDTEEPRANICHTVAYGRWLLVESNFVREADKWRKEYSDLMPQIEDDECKQEFDTSADVIDAGAAADRMPPLERAGQEEKGDYAASTVQRIENADGARSTAQGVDPLVGRRVSVFWGAENRAFEGTVVRVDEKGWHVQYDDGDYLIEERDVLDVL